MRKPFSAAYIAAERGFTSEATALFYAVDTEAWRNSHRQAVMDGRGEFAALWDANRGQEAT